MERISSSYHGASIYRNLANSEFDHHSHMFRSFLLYAHVFIASYFTVYFTVFCSYKTIDGGGTCGNRTNSTSR